MRTRKLLYINLYNDYHSTSCVLHVKTSNGDVSGAQPVSPGQLKRARKALCPDGCGCARDELGQRGCFPWTVAERDGAMYLVDSNIQDMSLKLEMDNIYCNVTTSPKHAPTIYIGRTINNTWIVYRKGFGGAGQLFGSDIAAVRAAAELSYRCYRAQQGSPV